MSTCQYEQVSSYIFAMMNMSILPFKTRAMQRPNVCNSGLARQIVGKGGTQYHQIHTDDIASLIDLNRRNEVQFKLNEWSHL